MVGMSYQIRYEFPTTNPYHHIGRYSMTQNMAQLPVLSNIALCM